MSRISHLSSAFKDHALTCGGHTLRPITAGTLMLLMESKNALFSDEEREAPITEAEAFQAMFEFIWIHVGPEREVIQQCDNPAELRSAARIFAMGIDIDAVADFSEQFTKVRTSLQAAMVEPADEKGPAGKKPEPEKPLPISSPPSSSSSEEPEIPSVNTSFSGNFPSAEPSNTTTPPSPTTVHQALGKSKIWEEPTTPQQPDNVIPLD